MSCFRRAHVSFSFCVTESVSCQPVVHFKVILVCESGQVSGGVGREREEEEEEEEK